MSDWYQHDWCASCVLVLSHFLWQGTLIALLTAIAIRAVRSTAVRYRLSLSALLLMAVCPVLTSGWLMQPVSAAYGFGTSLIVSLEIAPGSVVPSGSPDGDMADAAYATAGDENNPMYPRLEFRIAVTEADRNDKG